VHKAVLGWGKRYDETQLCGVPPDTAPHRHRAPAQPSSLSRGMFLLGVQPGAVKPLQG